MKLTRFLCVLLMLCAVLTCFAACQENEPAETTTKKPETPPAPAPDGQISMTELESLQIVYPFGMGDAYPTNAKRIAAAIQETYGLTVKVTPDSYGKAADCEIILGVCETREESLGSTVARRDDYTCSISGKKILLAAGSDGAMSALTDRFISSVVNAQGKTLFFDGETDAFSLNAEYLADTLHLGDADLLNSVIVYPRIHVNYEKEAADMLASHIYDMSGYKIPVISESAQHEAAHEIHVGFTARVSELYTATIENDAYCVQKTDFGALLVAGTGYGYHVMAKDLCQRLSEAANSEKDASVSLDGDITGEGTGERLIVMSFNVHYIDPDYGAINPDRVPNVIATILRANADVVGLQEVTPEWKNYLTDYLGNEYAFVGEGRDGGEKGEYSAIMYRKDKFELLESDTLWLSDTPELVSKYYESSLNRIVTYAKLQRKSDGQVFVHMNTHLDHKSSVACTKQANVLISIAARFKGTPVFMTGDFNSTQKSEAYSDLQKAGYKDSAKIAFVANEAPTAPSSSSVIDFCFATDKYVFATEYSVDTTKYGTDDPSDHCPVIAQFVFK